MSKRKKKMNKETKEVTLVLVAIVFVLIIGIVFGSILIKKVSDQRKPAIENGIVDDLPERFKNNSN